MKLLPANFDVNKQQKYINKLKRANNASLAITVAAGVIAIGSLISLRKDLKEFSQKVDSFVKQEEFAKVSLRDSCNLDTVEFKQLEKRASTGSILWQEALDSLKVAKDSINLKAIKIK